MRDDVAAVNAGVDNMQLGSIATATGGNELTILSNAYGAGKIIRARLDDATRRILTAMFEVGLFNHPPSDGANRNVSTPAHLALATRVAEQATVLLRNRGHVLPLSPRLGSIAVIGHDAGPGTQIEENGSPAVRHGPVISPLTGIRRLVGSRSRIVYAPGTLGVVPLAVIPAGALTPAAGSGHGLSARYYSGQTPSGTPVATRVDRTVDFASRAGAAGHDSRHAERHCGRVDGSAHSTEDRDLPVLPQGLGRSPALPRRPAHHRRECRVLHRRPFGRDRQLAGRSRRSPSRDWPG